MSARVRGRPCAALRPRPQPSALPRRAFRRDGTSLGYPCLWRGIKFVIAARSAGKGGGGELRNQLCLSLLIRSLSLYLTLQLDGLRLHVDGECRLQTSRQGVFVWCLLCTWPSGFWLEGECASSACGLLRCLTLRCTCAPLCTERVCFDLGWQECNEGSQRLCPPHASRARCSTKP